jgi:hypothetical protein
MTKNCFQKFTTSTRKVETPDGRIDANLIAETIRDTRQTEGITKEIAANEVFDFSYLPAR